MALSCYCKKCKMDVPAGQVCAACGSPLAPSSRRSAWCVDHHPVRDWMCWNAAMRIILPVMFLVLFLVLTLETLTGGTPAVEALLRGSFLLTMLAILLVVCFLVYLLFYM